MKIIKNLFCEKKIIFSLIFQNQQFNLLQPPDHSQKTTYPLIIRYN